MAQRKTAAPQAQHLLSRNRRLAAPALECAMECPPQFEALNYRGSGKLNGMTALVTGGDSGIGRAVAVLFAREGANIAIAYQNEHQDAQTTRTYVEAEGRQCLLLAGDVRDPAWCAKAAQQVADQFGALNILVNNAGFHADVLDLEHLPHAQAHTTLQTNVCGYIYMAQATLPYMHPGDCIINTGSSAGLTGCRYAMDYAASKGAIHAFTKSLALSVAERGIRVNAVAPGPVWTPMNAPDGKADDFANFGAEMPLGRGAQPQDVSPAYVFLASPITAGLITGIVLPVASMVGEA